jgi:hypothetical protein
MFTCRESWLVSGPQEEQSAVGAVILGDLFLLWLLLGFPRERVSDFLGVGYRLWSAKNGRGRTIVCWWLELVWNMEGAFGYLCGMVDREEQRNKKGSSQWDSLTRLTMPLSSSSK